MLKRLFYWWIEKDLMRYIGLIEKRSLKKKVESKSRPLIKNETIKSLTVSMIKDSIWNYGTFITINTYHEGIQRELSQTISDEAELAVSELVEVFLKCLGGEILPVEELFPTPDYNFTRDIGGVGATEKEFSTKCKGLWCFHL